MSLAEQLNKMKEATVARVPQEQLSILLGQTQDLIDSGMAERAIGVGDKLPPFALKNQDGVEVTSGDLLARGAVVLTVFRGQW